MKKENVQDENNKKIIANLRRVWVALRRQLGVNDLLIEDFKGNAEQILTNSGYNGPINDEIFNSIIELK